MIDTKELSRRTLNPKESTSCLTHNFHPYAAKFIPQIPAYFIEKFTKKHEVVLDPFCGSGSALVEALLLCRQAIGIDLHPIGVLASRVKTTKLKSGEIAKIQAVINRAEQEIAKYYNKSPARADSELSYQIPEFHNRDHWFQENILHELAILKSIINESRISEELKDFLRLAMSSIVVLVSNQESETRYVAINKNLAPQKTLQLFIKKVSDMVERMEAFSVSATDEEIKVYQADSRYIDFVKDNAVDFIITSPPYPNTYDYYLYHKQRMFWLDCDVKNVQDNEIGSRDKHSSKNEGIDTYIDSMKLCFKQFSRVLKPNKYFVFIIGDSVINEERFDGYEITKLLTRGTPFCVEKQIMFDLDKTSRLFNQAFRVKNKKEHFVVLKNKKNKLYE
jgi:site-specific DNA-methyltransferase (cytosine-N4-specific)